MDVTSSSKTLDLRGILAAQRTIAAALSGQPPTAQLFDRLLDTVTAALGFDFGALWRLDETGELSCAAAWNAAGTAQVGAFAARSLEQRLPHSRGLPGDVWATGAATWITDLVWDPRMASVAAAHRAGLQSAVAIPLGAGETFEGVLELFCVETRERDEDIVLWLESLGAVVTQHLALWRTLETVAGRDRALAAAVNGVVIADASQQGFPIVYANPGFTRLTGFTAQEIAGRPCSILNDPDTDPDAIEEMRSALRERREARVTLLNRRKDGSRFWNEVYLSPVFDDDGRLVQYIGVQNDVTERREAEEQAEFLAYHDSLTGLANRALLGRVLDRAVDRARRHERQAAMLILDIDGFKQVNDALGHAAGDALLRAVAERLRAVLRSGDLLARQGGDEFALVLADLEPSCAIAEALATAERIRAALAAPIELEEGTPKIRCSIGVSILGRDAHDAERLQRNADDAMYRAKRAGGSGVRLSRASADHPPALAVAGASGSDPAGAADRAGALDALLAGEGPRAVFQPIVELDSGEVVAYEALARGPQGSLVERPDQLFGTARAVGRLGELDWACSAAALRGAMEAGLDRPRRLFVNVEPEGLGQSCPAHLVDVFERAHAELDVVLEITERALTARPADLLHLVDEVRSRGWGIALDDVGADVRSLALMPLIRPDVIKLDLRLVQEQPSTEVAEIVNAVNAERERTGAIVLAEGIETADHLALARAMGATLGQGWLFGRPGELTPPVEPPRAPIVLTDVEHAGDGVSPYAVVTRVRGDVRRADKRLLLALSLQLEHQAAALGDSALIVSAFQTAERFTALTRRRYTLLAADAAFVAALGVGMDPEPAPGVRGAALGADDPLLGEWSVAVLGPHFAAALVAVDLGDSGPEMERRFDFSLTYDRDLVVEAAIALARRVQPIGDEPSRGPRSVSRKVQG
jgi:diguanylate cyclase (GGDEF)-like protein/PAS domain S-box-containing protein